MRRRRLFHIGVFGLIAAGCNAILENEAGVLGTQDVAGTLPEPGAVPSDPQAPTVSSDAEAPRDATVRPDTGPLGCPDGTRDCGGQCVSAVDPAFGCGDPTCTPCAAFAHATSVCSNGACAMGACAPGFGDCNALPGDGCEADFSKPTSCGACGAVCPVTAPLCAGTLGTYACTPGCPLPTQTLCSGQCVDTTTDKNHCGACNNVCPEIPNGVASCTQGVCNVECIPGTRPCAGRCVGKDDPGGCGPACVQCPAPPNTQPTCQANVCGAVCLPGFADCNAVPADGCEVDVRTNPAHCGACGVVCPTGVCAAGACM